MTMVRRTNTRGVIYKDGKLLSQELAPAADGTTYDWLMLPGGGLEDGESLHQGLHRELIEETGVAPKIGKLLFVQQFNDGTKELLEFFFHIENPDDYLNLDIAATTHGLLETVRTEFVDPRAHNVLPDFLQSEDITKYIDGTLPVSIYNNLA